MKQGKNPTREQKKYISSNGLYPGDWLVSKDTPKEMVLVHRFSTVNKVLKKE